jgi:hypothetical protein
MAKMSILFSTDGRSSCGINPVKCTFAPAQVVCQGDQLLLVCAFPANDQLEILPVEQRHGSQQHIQAFFPIHAADKEKDGFLRVDPVAFRQAERSTVGSGRKKWVFPPQEMGKTGGRTLAERSILAAVPDGQATASSRS